MVIFECCNLLKPWNLCSGPCKWFVYSPKLVFEIKSLPASLSHLRQFPVSSSVLLLSEGSMPPILRNDYQIHNILNFCQLEFRIGHIFKSACFIIWQCSSIRQSKISRWYCCPATDTHLFFGYRFGQPGWCTFRINVGQTMLHWTMSLFLCTHLAYSLETAWCCQMWWQRLFLKVDQYLWSSKSVNSTFFAARVASDGVHQSVEGWIVSPPSFRMSVPLPRQVLHSCFIDAVSKHTPLLLFLFSFFKKSSAFSKAFSIPFIWWNLYVWQSLVGEPLTWGPHRWLAQPICCT